ELQCGEGESEQRARVDRVTWNEHSTRFEERQNSGQEVAGILNLGVVDVGFEAMPSPLDADQLMPDAGGSEGPGKFLGLLDRNPEAVRAMDQGHRGGMAADVLNGGGVACLSGGIGGIVAQEDPHGVMSEALRSYEREPFEVRWAIEADNRLD